MKYDKLVFILRAQPFHLGHAKVIEFALTLADQVIILIGSANRARNFYNPFIYTERRDMILDWYLTDCGHLDASRLIIRPLNDHCDTTEWVTDVQAIVTGVSAPTDSVKLIGHNKDHTSFYLGLFPQWGEGINVEAFSNHGVYNATDVREQYFSESTWGSMPFNGNAAKLYEWTRVADGIPLATYRFLNKFSKTEEFATLKDEHEYEAVYKETHAFRDPTIKYAPAHIAVDAVVIQSGHILLIKRKFRPGKGLIALPGGFINPDERLVDAMLRELREETGLKVPEAVLKGSITKEAINDDPHRSNRGRVFSYSYLVELPPNTNGLPKVKGSDDAAKAWWEPLSELDPMKMFEDHYFIQERMRGM
jgi:bifunctional NMN adenylyltransferase/nudix hydrolase